MDRRDALKVMASGVFTPYFHTRTSTKFGWNYDRKSLKAFIKKHEHPYISQQNKLIRGTGKGNKAFLYRALEKLTGKFKPHNQGAPDCVAHGFALSVDVLQAIQKVIKRQPQRWIAMAATEPIYGGSREIGNALTGGGGSTGHWASEWLNTRGVLLRKIYSGYDFTTYSAEKAIKYGREGCPEPLIPLAMLHPVKKTAICRNYSELRDCLYNGYPVAVCSNAGFGSGRCKRDKDGFLIRRRRPWYHCMAFLAYDDGPRPGALCFNSWGPDWVYGPTRYDQPRGTFWIDAKTVDYMLGQGDSFTLSSLVGYPSLNIPPYILH